jgi:sugar lactone lactonase YvrE
MAPPSPSWRFEKLGETRATLGESPVWSAEENCLWWVDITGRRLFRSAASDGATQSWAMPEEIGFVVPAVGGAVVVGLESGLFTFDAAGGALELILELADPGARFNDACTDSAGRLWAATCDIANRAPLGKLYRIAPDLAAEAVLDGLMTPNGLAVDSARGRLYLSDSHPTVQALWSAPLDIATGALGRRRLLADFTELKGRPDGAAIDAAGTYWIAGVGGGVLHGFARDGARVAEVATPMAQPTKLAFGGAGLERIFLTSKSEAGKGDPGGCVMTALPGLSGRRETPFGYASA